MRPASLADAAILADVHASAFETPWSAADIAAVLEGPGAFGLVARGEGGEAAGFILCRAVAGEAEILTLAVRPDHRRHGLARALTETAAGIAASAACEAMFLEVAADNPGAIALYEQTGFASVGRRAGYYGRASGSSIDAIVMRRALNT